MANLILNSLEIRNFRAFHDLKIEHLKRVNLRSRREVEQVRRLLKPRAWIDENDDVDTSGAD